MKTLYLIRHAKSSWKFDVTDDKRPLNERGLSDAELVGNELSKKIKSVDKVLSSPAERAHTTAKIIVNYLDIDQSVFSLEPDLYDFEGRMVIDVIKKCDNNIDSLMIFGHNHAFTSITNLFGSETIDNLPTAGVVAIQFEVNEWQNITVGKTLFTIFPKSLR